MTTDELAHPRDLDADGVEGSDGRCSTAMADEGDRRCSGAVINATMHDPPQWIPYPHSAATLQSLRAARHRRRDRFQHRLGCPRPSSPITACPMCVTSFTLSYEAGFVKPDHRIFDAACASLGLDPGGRSLMVGDDPIADSGAVPSGHTDVAGADAAATGRQRCWRRPETRRNRWRNR